LLCSHGCRGDKLKSLIQLGKGFISDYVLNSFINVFNEKVYNYKYSKEGVIEYVEESQSIYYVVGYRARKFDKTKSYPSIYVYSADEGATVSDDKIIEFIVNSIIRENKIKPLR